MHTDLTTLSHPWTHKPLDLLIWGNKVFLLYQYRATTALILTSTALGTNVSPARLPDFPMGS
jgi:hypothetical protein